MKDKTVGLILFIAFLLILGFAAYFLKAEGIVDFSWFDEKYQAVIDWFKELG